MADQQRSQPVRLDSTQQLLFDALRARGVDGRSVLEIGCGIGHLHRCLLEEGASSAVGIELVAEHVENAKTLARERGLDDRTAYLHGDFMKLAGQIEPADITILDKVVHCYHDPRRLIQVSTSHTRALYAISFLRSRWLLRIAIRILAPFMRLFFPFRVRFSRPELIRAWIREQGFERIFDTEGETFHTEIYERRRPMVNG